MQIEHLETYKKNLLSLMHYLIRKDNAIQGFASDARLAAIDMPLNEEQLRKLEEITSDKPRSQELRSLIFYTHLNYELELLASFCKDTFNLYDTWSFIHIFKAYKRIKINNLSKYILIPLSYDTCASGLYLVLPTQHNLPVKCYAFDKGVHPDVYCVFEDNDFLDLVLREIRDWHDIPLRVIDYLQAGHDSKFFTDVCDWKGSIHATIICDTDESSELSDDLNAFKDICDLKVKYPSITPSV